MRSLFGVTGCRPGFCGALVAMAIGWGGAAAAEAARAEWPEFRGPWGNGHLAAPGDATPRGLPLRWSETENVKWKTELPHRGWSSPVVLDGQIWLTAATIKGNDFFAIRVDAATGKITFNERLFHADDPEPLSNNINCYASPSAAVEAGRAYVHFGSYGTACLDSATGAVVWERKDLRCRHYRGPGSSPIIFENLLVLTFDGVDVQYVIALDKITGENVWKTDRSTVWHDLDADGNPKREGDFRKAFSTPLIVEAGGKPQLLSIGSTVAFGYDPRTGRELWKARHAAYTAAARPVFGDGLAFVASGHGKTELYALRVDGAGDVTDTHVAWKIDNDKDMPQVPSPVLVDDLLYVVSNNGVATCLEAATGKVVWRERIGGSYMASPLYADGRIYFGSVQGQTTVVKPGRTYEKLAVNRLEAGFMASPAVAGKALILRTKTHLYRIEETGQ